MRPTTLVARHYYNRCVRDDLATRKMGIVTIIEKVASVAGTLTDEISRNSEKGIEVEQEIAIERS